MSVAERVRSYEAKTMSSTTSVGHCAPALYRLVGLYLQQQLNAGQNSPVSPTVVTPAASSSSTAPTTTNKLPSNVTLKASAAIKGKSAYKSTLHELLTGLLFIEAIKPPAPTSPSGNIIKRTFLRILSCGTWFRLGRRNTKSVWSTGLDEPRDSITQLVQDM
ncbi:hypothetical protein BASA83_008495 [Batrachochytrium salamandrivorans]|nr:hypothetical protein BASA83_008495 [Batrachochytrium salamandrivorans]